MGLALIALAGFGWILIFEPHWIVNHWKHWLFW